MATLTRDRLAELIRAAYAGHTDLEGPPSDGCLDCCWGNTCPEHAAAAVLAAIDGGDLPINREEH